MQVFITFVASAGAFFNLYQLQSLFPQLNALFGVSEAQAGPLNMATLLSLALMALFSSALLGRISSYRLIYSAFLLMAVCNAALAMVSEQWQLLVVRLAQGILIPLILSTLLRSARNTCADKKATVISAYVTGTILGSVFSRFGSAWLVDSTGWQSGFMIAAALMLLVCLLVYSQKSLFHEGDSDSLSSAEGEQASRINIRHWHQLAGADQHRLKVLLVIGFCILFSQSSMFTAIGLRLAVEYQLSASESGLIYLTAALAVFFPAVALNLARLYGQCMALLLIICLSVSAVLFSMVESLPLIAVAIAAFSVSAYMAQALTNYLISDLPAAAVRYGNGLYLFFYYLGGCSGALLSAWLYSHYSWGYVVASVASFQMVTASYVARQALASREKGIMKDRSVP